LDYKVYFITDRKQTLGRPLVEVVKRAVQAGIRAVQLREKDLQGKELFYLAEALRKVTANAGAHLLINDRVDIAAAVGADGVHLTRSSISPEYARKLLGSDIIIGQSTHSADEATMAQKEGVDFVTLGPVFPTPSKFKYGPPLGIKPIVTAREKVNIPIYAIGGIKAYNIKAVLEAGADGIALISAITGAENIESAVSSLLREAGN
jgi:thiamine-phosphate pyrophosphorylase